MFTGIIEEMADVMAYKKGVLVLTRPQAFDDIVVGSSISVSGVCLTVTTLDENSMTFDVIAETVDTSRLGKVKSGDPVNLERSLRIGARLDGHTVQGHTEGVAEVVSYKEQRLTVRLPDALVRYTVEKGSIAIDGVSLTVAELLGSECTVALIPHTIESTTLGNVSVGDVLNVETDVLVRTQVHA